MKIINKEISEHYTRSDVLQLIQSYTYKRELAFMTPEWYVKDQDTEIKFQIKRYMRAHNINGIKFWMNHLINRWQHNEFNMYSSVARYKDGIPYTHWDDDPNRGRFKNQQIKDNWKFNHWREISEYDLFIDIDCKDPSEFKYAKISAITLKEIFDELNCPYQIRFSGRGFHFVVPGYYFDFRYSLDPGVENNLYQKFATIARILQQDCSDMIDHKVYDSRRVIKLPGSTASYLSGIKVCTAINSEAQLHRCELKDFELDGYDYDKLLKPCVTFNKFGDTYDLMHKFGVNG